MLELGIKPPEMNPPVIHSPEVRIHVESTSQSSLRLQKSMNAFL